MPADKSVRVCTHAVRHGMAWHGAVTASHGHRVHSAFRLGEIHHSATHCLDPEIVDFCIENPRVYVYFRGRVFPHPRTLWMHGMARHGMARQGTAWHCTAPHGTQVCESLWPYIVMALYSYGPI